MKKIDEILEFNKIKEKLSEYAYSLDAKNMCSNLGLIKDKNELDTTINEVDSAVLYLRHVAPPNFNILRNVDNALLRLKKEAPLNIKELLDISNILELTDRLIAYKEGKEINSILDKYYNKLISLKYENNNIKKVIVSETEIADNASNVLQALRRKKQLLKEKLNTISNKLISTYSDYLQEPILANKDGALCLPIKAEYKNKIDGTIHSVSGSQFTIFIEPKEIISINNEIIENEALEEVEIAKILYELSKSLIPHIETIKSNYNILIKLDFIFAKAKYALDEKHTLPIINNEGKIKLIEAKHPLIDKNKIIPLDINLGIDFTSLIITGPNTGGKTVSIKTVGLIELMGLSGLFIPAKENSVISVFDNIFADIGDEQSIEQSLSTFSSHMTNIVSILKLATSKSLVLFDEICTGTDPVEGATLAISILDKLLKNKTRVIATTHYPELKKYALSKENVKNGAFEFNVETLKPTYKLLIGIPGKSNAFNISEKLGLSKDIIGNAKNLLENNDIRFEDIVSSLEESKLTIEREKSEIENYKKEIEELKDKVKRQEIGLNNRADSIIRQAKEKAHEILYDAKELADTTIKNIKSNNSNFGALVSERSKLNKELKEATESLIEKVKGPSKPISPKKIKVGASVKVLSLNAEGIVETLPDKDYNLFVRVGIIRTAVNLKDLELINIEDIKIDGTNIKRTYNKNGSSKIKLEKTYTINSEINLIGKTADEAIFELDKYIDDALLSHIPYVRIIHGRGAGILKKAVWKYLKNIPNIKECRLGNYNEGGDGVTIVTF